MRSATKGSSSTMRIGARHSCSDGFVGSSAAGVFLADEGPAAGESENGVLRPLEGDFSAASRDERDFIILLCSDGGELAADYAWGDGPPVITQAKYLRSFEVE